MSFNMIEVFACFVFRSYVYSVARDCDSGKIDRKVLLDIFTLLFLYILTLCSLLLSSI